MRKSAFIFENLFKSIKFSHHHHSHHHYHHHLHYHDNETGSGECVTVNCCSNQIPDTLPVTVTSKTGTCTCLPDSFDLAWNGSVWSATLGGAPCDVNTFILRCDGATGGCNDFTFNSGVCSFSPDVGCTCDPLNLVFSNVNLTGCACTGTATFEVDQGLSIACQELPPLKAQTVYYEWDAALDAWTKLNSNDPDPSFELPPGDFDGQLIEVEIS